MEKFDFEKLPMYCIIHETWLWWNFQKAWKDCLLTTSEPPELPDNWELTVSEPSPEELSRMNVAANDLLMDVIGAGL